MIQSSNLLWIYQRLLPGLVQEKTFDLINGMGGRDTWPTAVEKKTKFEFLNTRLAPSIANKDLLGLA